MSGFFSVILPTYNRANTLLRAIESVLVQTHKNYELIIIDDGSRDNTEELVNNLLIREVRIKYYKQVVNRGQNAALNIGLSMAKGEYISFIDSDDYWLPNLLEEQLKLYQISGFDCVYSLAQYLYKGKFVISKNFILEGSIYEKALNQGFVSHMITLSAKKYCFEKAGNFDENFIVCQDDDMCLRLAKYFKFGLIRKPLAVICTDGGNQTISNKFSYALGWEKLIEKFKIDIIEYCGVATLLKHYLRLSELYLYSLNFNKSFSYYKVSVVNHRFIYIKYLIFILKSKLPFQILYNFKKTIIRW